MRAATLAPCAGALTATTTRSCGPARRDRRCGHAPARLTAGRVIAAAIRGARSAASGRAARDGGYVVPAAREPGADEAADRAGAEMQTFMGGRFVVFGNDSGPPPAWSLTYE